MVGATAADRLAAIPRLELAALPTPLTRVAALSETLGIDLWIKRDDMTAGAAAGNKIRKLEYLFADAARQGADTVLTCGGIQSNHARATAIVAAQLGLRCGLLLRDRSLEKDHDGDGVKFQATGTGNLFLTQMVGADARMISAASYDRRDELLARWAKRLEAEGRRPYIIPEGGSNALGACGYIKAVHEIEKQREGAPPFDVIFHACGSGGTAAGAAIGATQTGVAHQVHVVVVCDDSPTFERRIKDLIEQTDELLGSVSGAADRLIVDDAFKGPSYAVSDEAQRETMRMVASKSGLILDPVYTGKAMHALVTRAKRGELNGKRVLFLHTGGLPGLLAQTEVF